MARKTKGTLPSGNVRVKVYDYRDADGREHYKSFTAPTKAQAQALAAEWKASRSAMAEPELTVEEAVRRTIELKKGAYSVTTYRSHESIYNNHVKGTTLGRMALSSLDDTRIQLYVSELSEVLSPKTVRNIWGVVHMSLSTFVPSRTFRVTLPQREKPRLYCPSTDEVVRILDHVRQRGDDELYRAILLACQGPLRLGEVCALRREDIDGNVIHVTKSKAQSSDNFWIIKTPKTYSSNRSLPYPEETTRLFDGMHGELFKSSPNALSLRFTDAVRASGVEHFSFHGLRHYGATILLRRGYSKKFVQYRGGWESPAMIDRIYDNFIKAEDDKENQKLVRFFSRELMMG